MSAEEPSSARPGTPADLSRRMDRMETAHELLAKEVGGLSTTIARVEQNQTHAEELNKMRFDAFTNGLMQVEGKLDRYNNKMTAFIERIEGMLTGEVETQQAREAREVLVDYRAWRARVDEQLSHVATQDAVDNALHQARASNGVWVRSAVPWIISGVGVTLAVLSFFNGAP